ncbi:MAG: regulator of chromosome condensation, partial [Acidimicrobiaceae bacterium]
LYVDRECCNGRGTAAERCGNDCDDRRPDVHPTESEVCDLADNDCDGTIDESVRLTCYDDADHDRYAPAGAASRMSCDCATGTTRMPPSGTDVDCDDTDETVNPMATDDCNGVDDDCDGSTDEGRLVSCYVDADADSFAPAGAVEMRLCSCPAMTTVTAPTTGFTDCNDAASMINPSRPEPCTPNGADDDCDGSIDEAGNDWYRDCDRDGYGTGTPTRECSDPGTPIGCPGGGGGFVLIPGDCNDASVAERPGADDVCNGRDDDCDLATADGADDARVDVTCDGADADSCRNGVQVCMAGAISCSEPGAGRVEICNGTDDDCDTAFDEGGDAECTARMLPFTTAATCTAGACRPETCAGSYNDCTAALGCETMCQWDGCSGSGCADPIAVAAYTNLSGPPTAVCTCALRRGGTVACWGEDAAGSHPTPVVVPGIADAVEVDGNCIRTAGGSVVRMTSELGGAWTFVAGLGSATQVACDYIGGCAVRADRTVFCWGGSTLGLLGNGSTAFTSSGVVVGLTDAVEVRTGFQRRCARRATGEVVCWGADIFGQLGDAA